MLHSNIVLSLSEQTECRTILIENNVKEIKEEEKKVDGASARALFERILLSVRKGYFCGIM